MTWCARITDAEGNKGDDYYSICGQCAHVEVCQLPKMAGNIAAIMTSIDTGCDGHMASGEAVLKCNGYEPKESAVPNPDSEG